MELDQFQKERYSRHLVLEGVGEKGQKKLLDSSVLVIGTGGLGSPAAFYLAAAGVGTIGLVDSDCVDLSNLQRQILHSANDIGIPKVLSAKESLLDLNPDICVKEINIRADINNIDSIIEPYDFVIEATDNFDSKFLVNDACVRNGKPFSHGGVMAYGGQLMTYVPGKSPCYRCIFGGPPPADNDPKSKAILSSVPGVIGSLQATEAIKYLTGTGELLTGRLLVFDALRMTFRRVELPAASCDCPVCSKKFQLTKEHE